MELILLSNLSTPVLVKVGSSGISDLVVALVTIEGNGGVSPAGAVAVVSSDVELVGLDGHAGSGSGLEQLWWTSTRTIHITKKKINALLEK